MSPNLDSPSTRGVQIVSNLNFFLGKLMKHGRFPLVEMWRGHSCAAVNFFPNSVSCWQSAYVWRRVESGHRIWNRVPFNIIFSLGKSQKSHGAMSGEYGAWRTTGILCLAKKSLNYMREMGWCIVMMELLRFCCPQIQSFASHSITKTA